MPVPFEIFAVFVSKPTETFSLTIEELSLIERFIFVKKLALPAYLPLVPLSFIIDLEGDHREVHLSNAVRLKLPCVYLTFVPSSVFVGDICFPSTQVLDLHI